MKDSFTWWRPKGFKKASKWPTAYLEACQKYHRFIYETPEKSVEGIWSDLAVWRAYKRDEPNLGEEYDSPIWVSFRESIAKTQARILKAVHDGDELYLKNLLKSAVTHKHKPPIPEINGIRSAILAFYFLYRHKLLSDPNAEWPTKQEVRRSAEQILKKAGQDLPSDRHWPRIFNKAGLWKLESATYGPARRRKRSPRII